MARTVAPKRSGTVEPVLEPKSGRVVGYSGRIHLADGTRKRLRVPDEFAYSDTRAKEWIEYAQQQEDLKGLHLKAKQNDEPRGPVDETEGDKWFDAWELSRKAKGLTSTRDNRSHYRLHIRVPLGAKHVRDWTPEDVRALVRSLDEKAQRGEMHWKYSINVWATAKKMCGDAVESKLDSLRVRADDPSANVQGPDRGGEKAKQFLYPSEFLQFVECAAVPIRWRVAVALAVFLYPRDGELRVLRWRDIDREHGVIRISRAWDRRARQEKTTKTKRVRRFNIEPNLLPLLESLHEGVTDESATVVELPSERDMSRGLKRWLLRAGVARHELHANSATTKGLTFHDLRATGLTWMAVRGDDALKIMHRAGHERFETTQRYVREAEAIREGFGDPFPTLPLDAFQKAKRVPPVTVEPSSLGPSWTEVLDSGPQPIETIAGRTGLECAASDTSREIAGEPEIGDRDIKPENSANPARPRDDRPAVQEPVHVDDPVETALAAALTEAAKAGRFDVVGALAKELESRRLARAANVISLDDARARRRR